MLMIVETQQATNWPVRDRTLSQVPAQANRLSQLNEDVVIPSAGVAPTGPVAQWIRRLPTEQEIPGSIPGRIEGGTIY